MSGKMLTPWERDDIRWKGNPAMERWTRWEDVLTSTATVQETAPQSGQFLVRWGNRDFDDSTIWIDGRPRHRTWGVPNFSSVADAKRAVDERLRFMGYVLPEDKVELVMVKGPEGPNITSTLTLQLQQKEAQLQQLGQSPREPQVSPELAICKAALADVTATLADRTKERDALVNGTWYGPWHPLDRVEGEAPHMVRVGPAGPSIMVVSQAPNVWQNPGSNTWGHWPQVAASPIPHASMTLAMQAADADLLQLHPNAYLAGGRYEAPNPALIWCPKCETVHVDEGELAWKPHRTHECIKCKHTWPAGGPGEFWVGVAPASGKEIK